LKPVLKKRDLRMWTGLEWLSTGLFCDCSKENSGSITDLKCFKQLNNYQFLKKYNSDSSFNRSEPSGNYMYHLLFQSVTVNGAFIGLV
jgi:hypothetical protein